MINYSANHGRNYGSPAAKAALAQCNAQYDECATSNGVIKQDNGSYAQMYHPANPDYIRCKKTIDDANSDAFRSCMKSRANSVTKASKPAVNDSKPKEAIVVAPAPCPEGSTANRDMPGMCQCNGEIAGVQIAAGSVQKCPSACKSADHKVYDPLARGCACLEGYEDRTGSGVCVALKTTPTNTTPTDTKVAECILELQNKVNSCKTAAKEAVTKCDANRESSDDDTLSTLQNLLGGVNSAVQAKNSGSGAMDNCINAGIASTSGYYALNSLREKCDDEISACNTSCTDADSYINTNKDKAYQACRKKVYDAESCLAASQWDISSEAAFNAHWDRVNKAGFEAEIQQLLTNVSDNKSKCETGTAVTNRDQISNFMSDMNNSVKSAAQCQCQLGSGSSGQDCSKQNGPAECALNPGLPGCAKLTGNCLDTNDTSARCVCFRNPGSDECKASQLVSAKINPTEVSSFAGGGSGAAGPNLGGDSSSGKTEVGDIAGDLSGLNAGVDFAGSASGSATTDAGSPFGAAAGGGVAGGSSGSGASADGANTAGGGGDDEGTGKKLGGLFDVAKSALGNLFKGKAGDKGSFDGVNKNGSNYSDGNGLDSKKWRPRGMVRGLAGDTELAGKFEDIWKVMNKQYKVQDQKDTFIFGGETK